MSNILFYVSPDGNDNNSGEKTSPFLTPQRAVDAVARLNSAGNSEDITVYFEAGEYNIKSIKLDELSGGKGGVVTYKALNGEVIINGGKTLKNEDFKPVTDKDMYSRFKPEARDKIRAIDLAAQGITNEDIGPMYAVGCANTSKEHNDGTFGNNCEVFWNDVRLTVARYPNKGFHHVEDVIEAGNRDILLPGIIKLQSETVDEIRTWKEPQKAWMFGYFMFDWAEQTTPIKMLDLESGTVQPCHCSVYGYKKDGEYYFLNAPEALDQEGEYYIDRENMLLYVYPPENCNDADALISISNDTLITGNVSNITFENIVFKGVRNDVIVLNGDNITIKGCKVLNSYGSGIAINGWNSYVYGCEVAYMGKGGVFLTGGDRATLTPGNCVVENCYIHHFEEIFRTYQQGIFIIGCGNKAIHNELAFAPHLAISYSGNDHLVEFNYIHDMVYESSDAGAFYAGGDWTAYGNVIRYNLFKDIGGVFGKWPKAIYFDDGMSGGEIYGNIIDNCYGRPLNFGGGRDIHAWNNLAISDIDFPLFYDDRLAKGGWAEGASLKSTEEGMWVSLDRVPYLSELWRKRFPRLAAIKRDLNEWESPDFPGNPAYSDIRNNVFIGKRSMPEDWHISDNVYKYSTIEDNHTFLTADEAVIPGTYLVKPEVMAEHNMVWEQIPYTEIGRYENPIKGR